MNHGPLVFLGVFFAVVASWFGLVVGPDLQLGDEEMVTIEATGQSYPLARSGEARQGAEVYRANGCYYCHTQQVRDRADGPDLARHWGTRRTVARDYLRDEPVMLGDLRLGPDLSNLGARETNTTTLLLKLYNARISMPGSTMPRYAFLFEQRKREPGHGAPAGALPLPPAFAPPVGYDVVPRPAALALVSYLQSLEAKPVFYEVFPTPPPKKATNHVAGTNVVAGATPMTNAPVAPSTAQPAK